MSRERARLGRLDSELPLLLREWPPETVQTERREVGRWAKAKQGDRGEVRDVSKKEQMPGKKRREDKVTEDRERQEEEFLSRYNLRVLRNNYTERGWLLR